MNKLLSCFCIVLVAAGMTGCGGSTDLPYFTTESGTPVWSADATVRSIPSFSLIDQEGEHVGSTNVTGTPYVASFFFVSCTNICPTLKSRLKVVADQFSADEVMILSHSVAPETDTVEKLAAYSTVNDIDPAQWKLLTGDKADILRLARDAYGAELRDYSVSAEPGSEFLHTETVFLVDGEGFIRGQYNGTLQSEINLLIDDLNTLLGRASV